MKYIFRDDNLLAEMPIKGFQIAHYNMEKDKKCFDEYFMDTQEFNAYDLATIYTEENKYDKIRSKIFVHHKNGEIYELQLKKLTDKEIKERGIWH